MKRIIWLVLAMTVLAGSAVADYVVILPDVILMLDPADGLRAGPPGTSVGWGYTLINTDPNTCVGIESLHFDDWTTVGTFPTPNVPLTMAAVGSPIISPWAQDSSGLQYDIGGPNAVPDASSHGYIWAVLDLYDYTGQVQGDQIFDPSGDPFGAYAQLSLSNGQNVIAEVNVTPEPGTTALLGLGLAAALALRRRLGLR